MCVSAAVRAELGLHIHTLGMYVYLVPSSWQNVRDQEGGHE